MQNGTKYFCIFFCFRTFKTFFFISRKSVTLARQLLYNYIIDDITWIRIIGAESRGKLFLTCSPKRIISKLLIRPYIGNFTSNYDHIASSILAVFYFMFEWKYKKNIGMKWLYLQNIKISFEKKCIFINDRCKRQL